MVNNTIKELISTLVEEYITSANSATKALSVASPNNMVPIAVSGKIVDKEELELLIESALDMHFTTGRFNKEFEELLQKFIGVQYVNTCNSGSSANLLAISALCSHLLGEKALQPGDEVITTAACFPTTVNPIIQNNLLPVFVDISLDTYNIDINLLEKALTKKTKAIVIAHTLGNPFNIEKVSAFAKEHNLFLVEDCCDALGSLYNGQHVGTFGDIATLSFYPAHHITMGEGGAVYTNNSLLNKIVISLRDWGRDCYCEPGVDDTCKKRFTRTYEELPYGYDHKYVYSHLGYNLKITDMQASIAVAQMKKLPSFIEKRKENYTKLYNGLQKHRKFLSFCTATENSLPSWFGFIITRNEDAPFTRNEFIAYLENSDIHTRLLFAGNITKQPYMKHYSYRIASPLKNTDIVMENTLWIGVYPKITPLQIDYVLERIDSFLDRYSNII